MELRELKKEVHELPHLGEEVKKFQKNWIKPLKRNSIKSFEKLSPEMQKQLNSKLAVMQDALISIGASQIIHDKLQHYARYLVELKLNQFQGNHTKSASITHRLLNDEFLNMKGTITEVKKMSNQVDALEQQYHEINELLHKELSLEETLFFMDLPHKKYLYNLMQTSKKQKKIVRHLGRHFISLAKKSPLSKRVHK